LDQKLKYILEEIDLPNEVISSSGEVSKQFTSRNITSLHDAIDYVYKLKYIPTSEPFNFRLVLPELHGTCSTKHTLLVVLAQELQLSIGLGLAIYNLTPDLFPELIEIYQYSHIPYIPVSHDFMIYNDQYLDVTFPGMCKILSPDDLIDEEKISPEQITGYKVEKYKKYVNKWGKEQDISVEQFYEAQTRCIEALGEAHSN